MTTTVRKGTGRPAAAAKRAKAAQKPPAEAKPTDNLDSMSLAEVRRLAVAQGWSTGTKGTKREIIALLRKHPDGPPAVAPKVRAAVGKRQAELANGNAAPRVREYRPITPGLGGSGEEKCKCVAELLKAAGWRVKVDDLKLSAQRGSESLTMAWTAKGAHSADDSSYQATPESKPRRIINVATGLRLARGQR